MDNFPQIYRQTVSHLFQDSELTVNYCAANFALQYYGIVVYLTESPLFMSKPMPGIALQTMLSTCLSAVQSFVKVLLSVEGPQFKFPYPCWVPVTHTLLALAKLSLFENESWDLEYVRSTLDLSAVLDSFIPMFQRLCVVAVMMEKIMMRFSAFKEVFEKRREMVLGVPQPLMNQGAHGNASGLDYTAQLAYRNTQIDDMFMENFGQLDKVFWQDAIGDWASF
jgi:hypothetical protein